MATCKLTKAESAELQKLVDALDAAQSALTEWLSERQAEWESAIEDRSEKWRESEAGQEAQERLDTLTGWLDEIPEGVLIDPGELS